MTDCRDCGAPIRWTQTPKGTRVPLDRHPSPHGTAAPAMVDGEWRALFLQPDEARAWAEAGGHLYRRHAETCPIRVASQIRAHARELLDYADAIHPPAPGDLWDAAGLDPDTAAPR